MDDLGDLDRSVDTLLVEFESVAETDEHNTMFLRSCTYKDDVITVFTFSVFISWMNDLNLLTLRGQYILLVEYESVTDTDVGNTIIS